MLVDFERASFYEVKGPAVQGAQGQPDVSLPEERDMNEPVRKRKRVEEPEAMDGTAEAEEAAEGARMVRNGSGSGSGSSDSK